MVVTSEPMLITLPPSPRCLAAAWVVSSSPSTLMSNWRRNEASVTSSSGATSYTPELLTSTSRRPNSRTAASTSAPASVALDTSAFTAIALPPAWVMRSTTASAPALLDA